MKSNRHHPDHHVSSIVTDALNLAAIAHKDQFRKDRTTPYIAHPMRMMALMMKWGCTDDNVLCATLLHDVLEDTDVPDWCIENAYGKDVCKKVKALTRCKGQSNDDYWSRLHEYAKHDLSIFAIKTADAIDNYQDRLRIKIVDEQSEKIFAQKRAKDFDRLQRLFHIFHENTIGCGMESYIVRAYSALAFTYEDAFHTVSNERALS